MKELTKSKNHHRNYCGVNRNIVINIASHAQRYSAWSRRKNLAHPINTTTYDNFPFIAPGNLNLFFASDRAGGAGGTDIWISRSKN